MVCCNLNLVDGVTTISSITYQTRRFESVLGILKFKQLSERNDIL